MASAYGTTNPMYSVGIERFCVSASDSQKSWKFGSAARVAVRPHTQICAPSVSGASATAAVSVRPSIQSESSPSTNTPITITSVSTWPSLVLAAMAIFDHVIESSKVGVRKPEPAFYELACATAGVEPSTVVFLDDLGINLKPAKAMGMATIKVASPEQALGELSTILGFALD